MRVGDKIAPLHHPIFKPANLPDFLAVARIGRGCGFLADCALIRLLAVWGGF
jgi:hypothetical protein